MYSVFALVLVVPFVKAADYLLFSTKLGPILFRMPRKRLRAQRNATVQRIWRYIPVQRTRKIAYNVVQVVLDILRVPPTPMSRLPKYTMNGVDIWTCTTLVEVDQAVLNIYNILDGAQHRIVAFDLEYANDGGEYRHRVDWIQVAIGNAVFLIRVGLPPWGLPASLQQLLGDEGVTKVGAGIHGDAQRLMSGYTSPVRSCIDLTVWARNVYPTHWPTNPTWWTLFTSPRCWFAADFRPTSLKKLEEIVARILNHNMGKDGGVRMGNWAVDVLSEEQKRYAAMDVHATYQVILRLMLTGLPPSSQ